MRAAHVTGLGHSSNTITACQQRPAWLVPSALVVGKTHVLFTFPKLFQEIQACELYFLTRLVQFSFCFLNNYLLLPTTYAHTYIYTYTHTYTVDAQLADQ